MIVVVGRPGTAAVRALAAAVAARGGRCEVVGTVSPDAAGDAVLQGLAAAGAGHAAVLRSPAIDLEPADLELALRYLPDARVVVLVGDDGLPDGLQADLTEVAVASAAWSGANLILVTAATASGLVTGDRSIALTPPARDPDGAFAGLVADLAARLDGGLPLAAAWPATLDSLGAEAVPATREPAPAEDPAADPATTP
ncbi:MAG TPA: hypothetical protein VJ506_00290 [Candidatus Limnocylindrales bacterium]|nr:hypothetical protein [Candidatus Limnocylindrales bacterium]